MYISKRDLEVLIEVLDILRNHIESGLDDEEHYFKLATDGHKLEEKAMRSHYRAATVRRLKKRGQGKL